MNNFIFFIGAGCGGLGVALGVYVWEKITWRRGRSTRVAAFHRRLRAQEYEIKEMRARYDRDIEQWLILLRNIGGEYAANHKKD